MAEYNSIPFRSCIKVKGIHLLPPVITQKRRAELQGYKHQAIKLEKRLKQCRELKNNLEELLNLQPLTQRPYSEISFEDDSHVEALGIAEKASNNNLAAKPTSQRKVKLSKDIIDVTQYNNDGIKIIYNDENFALLHEGRLSCDNSIENIDANTSAFKSSQIEYTPPLTANSGQSESSRSSQSKFNESNENNSSLNNNCVKNISSEKSPIPRLIRSNSYTLETPSPILLAHLERREREKQQEEKKLDGIKNLSISRNWSSLENNYIPFENSNGRSSTPMDKIDSTKIERSNSPAIEVVQTDISVQKITINANNEIVNSELDNNICEKSDSQLLQALSSLPDIYAKQIMELIESQKFEKKDFVEHKEELEKADDLTPKENFDLKTSTLNKDSRNEENLHNSVLTTNLKNEYHNLRHSVSSSESDKLQESLASVSPSQSIYYSSTSCDTIRPLSNCSVRLIDLDCDETFISEEKSVLPRKMDIAEYYAQEEIRQRMNVSRELFPQLSQSRINTIKQEWAASVIGAHVKGYLTRRLLKTERVQSLIETIKDALVCALQLHNSENIDESDVELHRRLMNQVSAACFTFHDIFFALTVQEQMLIIATDRQRKLEKAKRPASAPSDRRSKSSSNRSTPRQRVPSHSRSLTKV